MDSRETLPQTHVSCLRKPSLGRIPESTLLRFKRLFSKGILAQWNLALNLEVFLLWTRAPWLLQTGGLVMSSGEGDIGEKISDTQKDWKFFESFYTFCTYVAWIVFRRQHFTEIEEEIGRLFRTNLFNIPRRKREDEESGGEKKRMTLVQFRRMMAKRPAIKKAIHMRSPVMSTLLPSLREKAQDIFEKKNHQVGIKFPAQMQEHMESLDSVPMPTVGILGEPRCLFNPHTLLPLDLEENMKSDGRHSSLIEKNNMKIQDTLNLVMRTLSSQTTFSK
uniref:Protein phosphatase 1 regulatory subunit 36 n=1 Tax=Canis lupus familiaris TaxID=9615 RepID=A0A8C0RP40_CANLF